MRDSLNAPRCSKFLKALADPGRLRIVQCLQGGPLAVGEIAQRLGAPLANTSHHLKQLRVAGVVTTKRNGKQVIYALASRLLKRREGTGLDVLDFGCCRIELGHE